MAMTGEPLAAVTRKLDEAHEVLSRVKDTDEPGSLGEHFTEGTLRLRNASSFTEAGRPAAAAGIFAEVLADTALSRRDAGYFRSRRAAALALSGEPDEAAALGMEAFAVASATSSRRTTKVVVEVARNLEPWRHRPTVRELRHLVADPGRSAIQH